MIMALVSGVVSGTAVACEPVSYALDTRDSLLYLTVFKDDATLAAGLSHDHAIRAAAWSGRVRLDPADLSGCEIDVSLPVAALVVDEPWMRRVAGLEGELPEGVRDSVRKNMLREEQLHAAAHPTLSFSATRCTPTRIEGDLTIRGVTRRIAMPARLTATPGALSLTGEVFILATDFGFEPFSAMMGALKNQDRMRLSVTLSGTTDAAADAEL